MVVEKDVLDSVCSYCLLDKEPSELKRCVACKVARYCSLVCQKADWKLIHKSECPILCKLPGVPPTPTRALYQYLLRYPKAGNELDAWSAGLEHHVTDLKKDTKRWDEMVLQSRAAVDFSKSAPSKVEMVTRLLGIMATNAFRATLPDDSPIGLCFEPALALVNHSCSPNAFVMFDGRKVSLRALEHIEKGDEVFISYIDSTQGREIRRKELQQRYFFQCNCEKCTQDYSPYQAFQRAGLINPSKIDALLDRQALDDHATTRIPTMRQMSEDIEGFDRASCKASLLLDCSRGAELQDERLKLLREAHVELTPFRTHEVFAVPPYPTILDEIYLTFVDNERLAAALVVLLFIFFNCDVYNWPKSTHPARVTRLFTIVRLLKYVASLEPTVLVESLAPVPKELLSRLDYISTAHVLITIMLELGPLSHGEGTTFMAQIREEMVDVEEVQRLRGVNVDMLKAGGTFNDLRSLSKYAFDVIEMQKVQKNGHTADIA
ncbi:hypothetical protein BJ875DRAFT_387044 [Amylocarpus encephaloides]|uniref:Suppressor of anucleate metulae protein B n=1 Tax=Amylocarpus encephaloides TaxID=45428 RepID=A0A9P8C0N7_9HELO|nr:hypothetical protein BJ875DRAFT_387044 [Amylocarpus encephaloides]